MVQFSTHSGWWQLDKRQLSHDILNMIERLRIMHDLAKEESYQLISKEELLTDLEIGLKKLEKDFKAFIQ